MIISSDKFKPEILSSLFGGAYPAETLNISFPEDNKAHLKIRIIHLCPGNTVGLHQHKEDWEMFYILKGIIEVDDDGEKRIMSSGDVAIWAGGDCHAVKNISEVTAEYLTVVGKQML